MPLIESHASSTSIQTGTIQLGSGSVCTRSFWKSGTCCKGAILGDPFNNGGTTHYGSLDDRSKDSHNKMIMKG